MAELVKVDKGGGRGTGGFQRNQFLTFSLAGEVFALEIRYVREIIQYGGLTRVPLMPEFIRGVINLRGAVVPVVDLAVRLRRSQTESTKRTCIVILEVLRGERLATIGVLVDNVSEVLEIAENQIEAADSFGAGMRSEFIRGIGKLEDHFVILLEADLLLSRQELEKLPGDSDPPQEGMTPS
nr:chemotaxis protein CheW [uncultured Holophaga sp.]